MAENSSSSSSSSSSSTSSGEIESPIALLEAIETAIKAVCRMQAYRLGDRTVTYADLAQLRMARKELKAEVAEYQQARPLVASIDMRGNF